MTDEQRRTAEITRRLICTDERRQVLTEMAQRAEIYEQLNDIEAIEAGHRAALAH